jgi:diguanylate cyclase (GGDEF)-like protein
MVDGATPVIIDGKHIANLFTGQVQFQEPNIEEFKKDAKEFGYDEKKYLEALEKVKVVNEDEFRKTLKFLGSLAQIISELTMLNNKLKKENEKEIKLRKELEELNNSLEQKVIERTKELERIASIDELTNIYNRRKFFKLGHEMYENESILSAVMVDLNKFKNINDTYGHKVGDEVLKHVVSTIDKLLPKDALFGRIGGDEFAILLKYNKEDSKQIMENISLQISKEEIKYGEVFIKTSISYGVSMKSSSHKTLDFLLQEADESLYNMKRDMRIEFRV